MSAINLHHRKNVCKTRGFVHSFLFKYRSLYRNRTAALSHRRNSEGWMFMAARTHLLGTAFGTGLSSPTNHRLELRVSKNSERPGREERRLGPGSGCGTSLLRWHRDPSSLWAVLGRLGAAASGTSRSGLGGFSWELCFPRPPPSSHPNEKITKNVYLSS